MVALLLAIMVITPLQPAILELSPSLSTVSADTEIGCDMPCCKGKPASACCCIKKSSAKPVTQGYLFSSQLNNNLLPLPTNGLMAGEEVSQTSSHCNANHTEDKTPIATKIAQAVKPTPAIKPNLNKHLATESLPNGSVLTKEQMMADCPCDKRASSFNYKHLDTLLNLVAGVKPPPPAIIRKALFNQQFTVSFIFNHQICPRAPPTLIA